MTVGGFEPIEVQVELEAPPPDELYALCLRAIDGFWNESVYQRALCQEQRDRAQLAALIRRPRRR